MLTRDTLAKAARGRIADGYELYLVSNREVLTGLETRPYDLPATAIDFLDQRGADWDPRDFMRVYNKLNEVSFGPTGIPLPFWVMVDLGLLSSAFLLLTLPQHRLEAMASDGNVDPAVRLDRQHKLVPLLDDAMRLGFEGPIPVAGYCAAPTPVSGHWAGWSMCSAIPGEDLGAIAKGLALEAYKAKSVTGVTQFNSSATYIHRKFGRMELLAATLDLHTVPHTYVYRSELFVEDDREPTFLMDAKDVSTQQVMQANIEAGTHRYHVLPPGLYKDGPHKGHVPIHEERL